MINLGISLLDFKPSYSGGINSFSLGLAKSLEKKCKLFIYTNKNSYSFLKKKFPKSKIIIFKKNNFAYLFILLMSLLIKSEKLFKYNELNYFRKLNKKINRECDVFYCPLSYLKPLGLKIPTVTSIHDLQHHHLPKNFNFIQLIYRKFMYKITVDHSTTLQASTNFIKSDIKKVYPKTDKKKIIVINEGILKNFSFKKLDKKNNFIFFPAQLWPHKNHMVVLKSLKEIYIKKNINLKLIMVGGKFAAYKKINNFIKKNKFLKIKYLGDVSFSKLCFL